MKASLAAPGSYPSLFSRVLPLWILLSCACLFCPVTFCQQFLFHLWFLSHKHLVSFINSHLASTFLFFPAPLIKDFPSFVFSLPPLLSCSLPLSPSLPSHPGTPSPLLPLPQCHCVHMAPACDMKLSQNTPDARFSPSLFQTLLNFKQNKRTGEGGRMRRKRKVSTWGQGNVQQHHNFIHSLVLSLCIITRAQPFNSCPLSIYWCERLSLVSVLSLSALGRTS